MKFTTRCTVVDARWPVAASDLCRRIRVVGAMSVSARCAPSLATGRHASARSPPHLRKRVVDLAICVLFTACPKLSRLPTENTGPLRLAA